MTLRNFKSKIYRGLGSAILELKSQADISKYKDIVLWACLHDTCYDAQVEGTRGIYLYEAICCFSDKDFFEDAIIHQLSKRNGLWVNDQLISILYRFACDGSQKAVKAFYDKFNYYINYLSKRRSVYHDERESLECLVLYICDLHGFRAYKKIIIEIGKVIVKLNSTDMFSLDWFFASSKMKFGKERVIEYLEKQSQTSIYVKAFYDFVAGTIESAEEYQKNIPKDNITIEDVLNFPMDDNLYRIRVRNLARRLNRILTEEGKIELANSILSESDLVNKSLMLKVFEFSEFPLSIDILINYANSDYKPLRKSAYNALAQIKSNEIHDLAVSLLCKKENIIEALDMLKLNYHKDDKLIYSITKDFKENTRYDFHGLEMVVRDIYRQNKSKNSYKTLIYIYNKGRCSHCREWIVRTMHDNKLLPDAVLHECVYDSNADLRKFAKRILSRRK